MQSHLERRGVFNILKRFVIPRPIILQRIYPAPAIRSWMSAIRCRRLYLS